jgi:hypothetical protein
MRNWRLSAWVAFAALALVPQAKAACLVPGATPMVILTFYFGENIPGAPQLTPAQWDDFAATVVTPVFPDGLTVTDGQGQWMDPRTKVISHDPTKILTVAVVDSPGLAAKIGKVIAAYKTAYHQQSVGIITEEACAKF